MEYWVKKENISIHALREESDSSRTFTQLAQAISIHALREESDQIFYAKIEVIVYFYPRSP